MYRGKLYADRAKDTDKIGAAWSRFWEEKYQERYGEDILDRLPEIFWLTVDGSDSEIKYRYYDLCSELFARAFSDQCGKWCESHGLALTGHILREATLKEQAPAVGDNMRQYRPFTIPGIDILCEEGASVYCAADGTVFSVYEDPMMGYCVAVKHAGGLLSLYQNLSSTHASGISVGSSVKGGQLIGTVGDSAMLEVAEEAHLHFAVFLEEEELDPLTCMSESARDRLIGDDSVTE